MNFKMIGKYMGYLVWAEGAFMAAPALAALYYGETQVVFSFIATATICGLAGLALFLTCRSSSGSIYVRESFVVAGGGWILISLLGALPSIIGREIPSFIDAFFESVSGFTTTGGSILPNVEELSNGLLLWRSMTNWLGGIGVLVFILAIVRSQKGAGFTLHLLRAESPGPQVGKIRAKTRDSARIIFLIYIGLTLTYLVFLLLGGMPVFEAVCAMFSTAGTGGFGVKADSFASYSLYLQIVTAVFMALFGVNFALYFLLIRKDFKAVTHDSELRLYGFFLGAATLSFTISLVLFSNFGLGGSLREAFFATTSIMSSTGYSLSDFNLWPEFSRSVVLVLMLIGGMAGSTAGGFKVSRVLILLKSIKAGLHRLLHPRSVKAVKVNGKTVDDDVLRGTMLFLSVYIGIAIISFLLISVDGNQLDTNISAVISSLNNVGPGLGAVGPAASFAQYSAFSKLVLILNMLLGRLEIFPILLLLSPSTWKRKA